MAGRGPAPKVNRQRRNEPARGEWTNLDPLDEPVLPDELPEVEGGWRPQTIATWRAWRKDPVTARWSTADIAYALDTILLHNAMTPSSASEVRLRMDALGLTPKGKKDLRWKLPEEAQVVEHPKAKRERKLRAV